MDQEGSGSEENSNEEEEGEAKWARTQTQENLPCKFPCVDCPDAELNTPKQVERHQASKGHKAAVKLNKKKRSEAYHAKLSPAEQKAKEERKKQKADLAREKRMEKVRAKRKAKAQRKWERQQAEKAKNGEGEEDKVQSKQTKSSIKKHSGKKRKVMT